MDATPEREGRPPGSHQDATSELQGRTAAPIDHEASAAAASTRNQRRIAPRIATLSLVVIAVLVGAACGGADDDAAGSQDLHRTVEIEMVDIAFKPKSIEVTRGETVRFIFRNNGKVAHDAFIGDTAAQQRHEDDMRHSADPGHGDHGDDNEAVTVDPGSTRELTHTFNERGALEIGCHQPGHYGAGMKVTVRVA